MNTQQRKVGVIPQTSDNRGVIDLKTYDVGLFSCQPINIPLVQYSAFVDDGNMVCQLLQLLQDMARKEYGYTLFPVQPLQDQS